MPSCFLPSPYLLEKPGIICRNQHRIFFMWWIKPGTLIGNIWYRKKEVRAGHSIRNPKSDGVSFFFAYCEDEQEEGTICLELQAQIKVWARLPREIMEKNRTSLPPFLEMAVLETELFTEVKAASERLISSLQSSFQAWQKFHTKSLTYWKTELWKVDLTS